VRNHFSGPLRERDQDVERSATEWYRLVSLLEQPLGYTQAERTKGKYGVVLRVAEIIHTRYSPCYAASGDP
jgi:hypothetical protein